MKAIFGLRKKLRPSFLEYGYILFLSQNSMMFRAYSSSIKVVHAAWSQPKLALAIFKSTPSVSNRFELMEFWRNVGQSVSRRGCSVQGCTEGRGHFGSMAQFSGNRHAIGKFELDQIGHIRNLANMSRNNCE